MTLVFDITPQLEARLKERATREGRDEAEVAPRAIETYLATASDLPANRTVGEHILAQLDAEGVLGLWQDRPEDTIVFARELRNLAEARGIPE